MSDFDIDIPFLSSIEHQTQESRSGRFFHPLTGLPLSRPTLEARQVRKGANNNQDSKKESLLEAEDSKVRWIKNNYQYFSPSLQIDSPSKEVVKIEAESNNCER